MNGHADMGVWQGLTVEMVRSVDTTNEGQLDATCRRLDPPRGTTRRR